MDAPGFCRSSAFEFFLNAHPRKRTTPGETDRQEWVPISVSRKLQAIHQADDHLIVFLDPVLHHCATALLTVPAGFSSGSFGHTMTGVDQSSCLR